MTNNKKMFQGIIIGTLIPLFIVSIISIYLKVDFDLLFEYPRIFSPYLQMGIVGNLLVFYYYMIKNKQEEQKGIVLPTLVFALISIILKYY